MSFKTEVETKTLPDKESMKESRPAHSIPAMEKLLKGVMQDEVIEYSIVTRSYVKK